jgi:opacity protein-like surface antigen
MWLIRRGLASRAAVIGRVAGGVIASVVAAVASLTSVAPPAAAEWYGDLYAGIGFTQSHNVFEQPDNGVQIVSHTFLDVQVDNTATYGGRTGYWSESLPWLGIGLDVFHFEPNMPQQLRTFAVVNIAVPFTFQEVDVSVTAVAFDLLRLRYPLFTSPEFPKGRLQPYFAGGPAIFITTVTDTSHFTPNGQSDTKTPLGAKLSAGLTWHITPLIGIFGEYRFTYFNVTPVFISTAQGALAVPQTSTFYTHHLLAGVSLAF